MEYLNYLFNIIDVLVAIPVVKDTSFFLISVLGINVVISLLKD